MSPSCDHVEPLADKVLPRPGAAPEGALDFGRFVPIFLKLLSIFQTGTGFFTTNLPRWGKRWIIVSDKPPEGG